MANERVNVCDHVGSGKTLREDDGKFKYTVI